MATLFRSSKCGRGNVVALLIRKQVSGLSYLYKSEVFNGLSDVPQFFPAKRAQGLENYKGVSVGNGLSTGEKVR